MGLFTSTGKLAAVLVLALGFVGCKTPNQESGSAVKETFDNGLAAGRLYTQIDCRDLGAIFGNLANDCDATLLFSPDGKKVWYNWGQQDVAAALRGDVRRTFVGVHNGVYQEVYDISMSNGRRIKASLGYDKRLIFWESSVNGSSVWTAYSYRSVWMAETSLVPRVAQ